MKKANWTVIDPRKISKSAFWVRYQEQKLDSGDMEDMLAGLATNFRQKSIQKGEKDSAVRKVITNKYVDLRVISQKSALAISILLAASLKRVSYEKFKECILRCDTSILNSDIIQQLIKYLPPTEKTRRFEETW